MPCSSCTFHHMPHSCHALTVGLAEADREGREHGGAHLGARLPPEFSVLRVMRPHEQHALAIEHSCCAILCCRSMKTSTDSLWLFEQLALLRWIGRAARARARRPPRGCRCAATCVCAGVPGLMLGLTQDRDSEGNPLWHMVIATEVRAPPEGSSCRHRKNRACNANWVPNDV